MIEESAPFLDHLCKILTNSIMDFHNFYALPDCLMLRDLASKPDDENYEISKLKQVLRHPL